MAHGDFSLNFETVYFVLKADYNDYMDAQQAINQGIHARFDDMGVEFAFPTQTIHLVSQRDSEDSAPAKTTTFQPPKAANSGLSRRDNGGKRSR